MNKPAIDLSDEMMDKYKELGDYYAANAISDDMATGKLIGKFSGKLINGKIIFTLTWGYSIPDENNTISLDELKTINFIGNLHTMLDENYSIELMSIIFALFGTISKYYNKKCILKSIAGTSHGVGLPDDELIYLSL